MPRLFAPKVGFDRTKSELETRRRSEAVICADTHRSDQSERRARYANPAEDGVCDYTPRLRARRVLLSPVVQVRRLRACVVSFGSNCTLCVCICGCVGG